MESWWKNLLINFVWIFIPKFRFHLDNGYELGLWSILKLGSLVVMELCLVSSFLNLISLGFWIDLQGLIFVVLTMRSKDSCSSSSSGIYAQVLLGRLTKPCSWKAKRFWIGIEC